MSAPHNINDTVYVARTHLMDGKDSQWIIVIQAYIIQDIHIDIVGRERVDGSKRLYINNYRYRLKSATCETNFIADISYIDVYTNASSAELYAFDKLKEEYEKNI